MSPLIGNRAEGSAEGMSSAAAPAIYAECVSPYLEVMRRERAQFHQAIVELLADSSYQAAYYDAWIRCCSTVMSVISWVLINTLLRAAADPGSSMQLQEVDGEQVGVEVRFSDGSEVCVAPSIRDVARITFRHRKHQWCPPSLRGPTPPEMDRLQSSLPKDGRCEQQGDCNGS